MTEPYTPTEDEIRDVYVRALRAAFVASAGEAGTEFNRALDRIKNAAAREALTRASECMRGAMDEPWGDRAANRIEEWARTTYYPKETTDD